MTQKTAILIFSRSASAESNAKSFLPDQKRNYRIAKTLIDHVIQITQEVDRPYVLFDEHLQTGLTFGERFSNAFSYAFQQGYENIIAIGSDSPNLSSENLKEAIYHVEQGKIVLGPDFHNGIYLIGISKNYFFENRFESLPWQTTALKNAIEIYAKAQTEKIIFLDQLEDINTETELLEFLESDPRKEGIYYQLFLIVFPFHKEIDIPVKDKSPSLFIHSTTSRGPPTDYISYN